MSDDSSTDIPGVKGKKEIVSDKEWENYTIKMYPVKSLQGELLDLLKRELEEEFFIDPEKQDGEDRDDWGREEQSDNLLKFCKMCAEADAKGAGLAWVNALHQFEDDDDEDEDEDEEYQKSGKYTPLTYVIDNDPDDHRTVDLLLQCGADPNLRDGSGAPPLYKVITGEGRWRTANLLMKAGANPRADYGGKSMAEWAKMYAKNNECVQMLWEDIKAELKIYDEEMDEEDAGY